MYAKTTSMLILLALPVLVLSGCQSGVGVQSNPTASEAASSQTGSTQQTESGGDGSTGTEDDHDTDHTHASPEPELSESQEVTESSSNYLSNYTLLDTEFGTEVTVNVTNGIRTIVSNSLPNHITGDFPNSGNPNSISAQSKSWSFPATGTSTGVGVTAREPGVALNGVKFEPGTAETVTCQSGERYAVEGLQDVYDLGMDVNNAHVQPSGEYHYHGISEFLVDAFDDDADLVLVGFAADGFLIYYSKSNAYKSGYKLSEELRSGTSCVMSLTRGGSNAFDLDGTAPDGTYTSDWVLSPRSGSLDKCNGGMISGEYAYLITSSFPFISRCLMGEFTEKAGPNGPAGGPSR
jgi:hypothetical protein